MSIATKVELGGSTKENINIINTNFTNLEQAIAQGGGGDMMTGTYDTDGNGIVDNAEKVNHSLTIKFGTSDFVEGNSKYTFNGSAAKELNFHNGSNVSISTENGVATINATNTVTRINTGASPNISSSLASGDITLGEAAAKQVSASIPTSNPTQAQEATLPTLKAVKDYVDNAVTSDMKYQGTIDGGDTESYGEFTPAATVGDYYKVSQDGKLNGIPVEVGDTLICNHEDTPQANASNYTLVATYWDILQGNIEGAITTSDTVPITSGSIPVYSNTTGKVIHSSGVVLPQNPAFTDTVPIKTEFNNSTYWSENATNGVYTLTLTIDSGRYPVAVFNSSGAQVMVGVNIVSATSITIESYSKFAGYVILV